MLGRIVRGITGLELSVYTPAIGSHAAFGDNMASRHCDSLDCLQFSIRPSVGLPSHLCEVTFRTHKAKHVMCGVDGKCISPRLVNVWRQVGLKITTILAV
jgi:hypothetical protein